MGKTNRIGGIGMIAQCVTGETRPVIRNRRGVLWCPFCDRSRMNIGGEMICDGCNAVFKDDPADVVEETTPDYLDDKAVDPPRRRRRKASDAYNVSDETPDAE